MSTLKVGVIGVGGIARTHMPGWAASEEAEVVGGCDVNQDVLGQWGDEHGVKRLVTDPADLFSDPDLDIIDVCTPHALHAPFSIGALDAGKHVICEKPLAVKPDEIRQMIAARDRSGKLLMTAQHFRFSGTSKALKAEIETGALGNVYHARNWMLRRAAAPNTPGFVVKAQAGGGPCIDIGVHILDLTLWMMGHPTPVAVSGVARNEIARQDGSFSIWAGPLTDQYDVEDFACAFVRFDNGATLILEVSWMLHHPAPHTEDMQMWLYGTDGGCQWPDCRFYRTSFPTRQFHDSRLMRTKDALEPHAQECFEFADAVRDGAPSPVPPEQSLQVMTILDAIYRSQESGREIRLDEA
ncbi:MAG: oxidoreductase [Phycisphaeraceae bacterium]|nr:oxidoreductase [Phycisphaeraceae bacterium]